MSNPFLGTILPWAPNFAPRGWAFCSGQLLSISQNSALFSLIGTYYGGDGRTTFALPDLRGRAPAGVGNGPGTYPVKQGERLGAETVAIGISNLPSFSASINSPANAAAVPAANATANQNTPTGHVYAKPSFQGDSINSYTDTGSSTVQVPATVESGTARFSGQSLPFNNIQPSLGVNYIIALQGIYPSRS